MSRTVTNALGEPLSYGGSSTAWFSASGSGPLLYGTAGNDRCGLTVPSMSL